MKRIIIAIIIGLLPVLLVSPAAAATAGHNDSALPGIIQITGRPAHGNLLKEAAKNNLERAGYDPSVLEEVKFSTLFPGSRLVLEIPLKKAGDETGTLADPWKVTFENRPVPAIKTLLLAFSNHPEKLKKPGLLFEAGLIKFKPVRLRYYHHVEKDGKPHHVGIYLYNPTRRPARVHLLGAAGGPSANFLMAGHMANVKFFHRLSTGQGWVEEVPSGGAHRVMSFPVGKGEVISGTLDLLLFEGGPLQVLVNSSENPGDSITYPLQTDKDDRHARGAYPLTSIVTRASFFMEQGERFFTIGDTPLTDIFGGRNIRGNYGVSYEYDFTLVNDTGRAGAVNFAFQPRGGVATATFLVDGRMVSIGATRAYQVVPIARVPLSAGSRKTVRVVTMPEDASNYPVRIILKSTPMKR